ncbi:Ferrous iron transport protein B [Pelotomaculum schinkii]|uniref:Ferrous iron transport protein B n=1 Tax=Pelotomaculum schinkii TaxID=78350 RepID=A0A4Y7RFP8_9FIRM|nr:ferrous iron transport protein B [Pelotomaculum schinkii]TEB07828.1 Ferrous iron transport protein B [Pelotomaculum schinkii]
MEAAQAIKNEKQIVVALAGNPNSGKTTIFNSLTGAHQHVGNWPGVTVEKKEGQLVSEGKVIRVVDLPGTYSLGAYSEDEAVARDYILFEKPDVVINIIDATNLERNLYLTTQLLEMGSNLVIALNMSDELKAKQIDINAARFSELLGVPAIRTVGTRGQGTKELVAQALQAAGNKNPRVVQINYGKEVETELAALEQDILSNRQLVENFAPRWLAVKVLEGDQGVLKSLAKYPGLERLLARRAEAVKRLEGLLGEDIESLLADKRYGFIGGLAKEVMTRRQTTEERLSRSDKIDRIVTNRYLGIPIFLFAMWAIFQFTFTVGDPFIGWIETFFEWFGGVTGAWLESAGMPGLLMSLIVDGIIGGVGSVLVFIPNIFLLFFAISLLEDSGYMARAAFIMDRLMHALGLHGKSFIPLLIGFGCNVPAVMATRTLENKRDRLITILITPLMSCTARLPVYILFAGAFFTANQGLVIFSLYLLGLALAILMGMLFKRFLFKGETSHFVMELPPYRVPTLKSTFIHMWEKGSSFIRKAGTIIFAVVVLVWALSNLPVGVEYASQDSILGWIGSFVAPIFKPAGFGTWEAAVALVFGILAKEVVVGTLGVIYGAEEAGLTAAIAQAWTPLSAYAFMVMTLLYIPCAAVIGTIKRETNSWTWTAFAVAYTLVLGWLMAVLVYQFGRLLGLG